MNDGHDRATGFDQELLGRLRGVVAERAASLDSEGASASSSTPAWRRPPRLLAGAGVAMAAVIAALFISAGGEGTSAAYAVEAQSNGNVTVQIDHLSDASGLETALAQVGIPAEVTYLPEGMTCSRSGLNAYPARSLVFGHLNSEGVSDGPLSFVLEQNSLAPGQTLVVTAAAAPSSESINGATLQSVQVATGKVAPCDPVPVATSSGRG